ncbi:hypothetical protein NMY22_g6832 [Coprinellus aureogranulatus]|nr:hypothetical protein NMY22_g6832 [Coprinellus aureogranulatus]
MRRTKTTFYLAIRKTTTLEGNFGASFSVGVAMIQPEVAVEKDGATAVGSHQARQPRLTSREYLVDMGDYAGSSSSSYYHKRRFEDTDSLDITVTIQYREPKATQFFSTFTNQSMSILRSDLIALKVPHPKSENVTLASHGRVEFSWAGVEPYKVLHLNLIHKLRPLDPGYQELFKRALDECSIASATFREIPSAQSASASTSGYTNKRPYQSSQDDFDPPHKKFASGPSGPRGDQAAEKFLNDTLKTLAVKSEPVDVPLPPSASSISSATLSSRLSRFGPPVERPSPSSTTWEKPRDPPVEVKAEPTLKDLMGELWEVRKTLSSAGEREAALVEKIQKLHPQLKIPPTPEQKEVIALKAHLEEARSDAAAQRKEKEELQRSLDSIRRESKEPFIVPELIDAFLSISNLASKIR